WPERAAGVVACGPPYVVVSRVRHGQDAPGGQPVAPTSASPLRGGPSCRRSSLGVRSSPGVRSALRLAPALGRSPASLAAARLPGPLNAQRQGSWCIVVPQFPFSLKEGGSWSVITLFP